MPTAPYFIVRPEADLVRPPSALERILQLEQQLGEAHAEATALKAELADRDFRLSTIGTVIGTRGFVRRATVVVCGRRNTPQALDTFDDMTERTQMEVL